MRIIGSVLLLLMLGFGSTAAGQPNIFHPDRVFGPFVDQGPLVSGEVGFQFGRQLALAGDTALVLGENIVYVFDRTPGTDVWTESAPIVPESVEGFGRSLAFDRRTAIVGAQGAASLYRRTRLGSWREVARFTAPDGNPNFGIDVDIDRDYAIVAAPSGSPVDVPGAAYILHREKGEGWQQAAKLEDLRFGRYVGISGATAIVSHVTATSAATVFEGGGSGPGTWTPVKSLQTFLPIQSNAVDIDGDVAAIAGLGNSSQTACVGQVTDSDFGPWSSSSGWIESSFCFSGFSSIDISGDMVMTLGSGRVVDIRARNEGTPGRWGRISRFITSFSTPGTSFRGAAIDGDTILITSVSSYPDHNGIMVLTSDVDGDSLRDGIDPCPRDPLNNIDQGCRRAADVHPSLDGLVTQTGLEMSSPKPNRQVFTATYTNTSGVAIRNPFFEVAGMTHRLLNADEGRGGSTLTPDVGNGVLAAGETLSVEFVFRGSAPVDFSLTFRGDL